MTIRCLVVEDDDFTRVTLEAALRSEGFDVAGAVSVASEALMITGTQPVDVALVDLDLGPGPTGIDLAFGLRRVRPQIGIVVLTSFSDPRLLTSSVRQPPAGSTYVVKQSLTNLGILSEAIRGTADGGTAAAVAHIGVALTDAQIETLRLLAYGLSNEEIARARFVTLKGVEQSVRRISESLGLDRKSGSNLRVALAREYFKMTGAARHTYV